MTRLASDHNNSIKVLKCIAMFAPRNADGSLQSEIAMSPSAQATWNQTPEKAEYISEESGLGEVLATRVTKLPRKINLTCNRLSQDIKDLFFIANSVANAQASATVTLEQSAYVFPGRAVQLGGSRNNGTGVFGVTSPVATIWEGTNAPEWTGGATYAVGDYVIPTTPNSHWYMATAITTGVAHASTEPTWPTNGGTVVDVGVTWTDMGLIAIANTSSSAYELDGDLGRLNVLLTGQLAEVFAKIPASLKAVGRTFRLSTGYTLAAHTFNQMSTAEVANLEGALRLIEQSPDGDNNVWYCPQVSLAPTGDFSLKTGTNFGAMTFEVSVEKPAAAPAMTQNGIPVN